MKLLRAPLFWEIAGGLVSALILFAALGELLWWSLYLSDSTNVSRTATVAIHIFAGIALISLAAYMKGRNIREQALAGRASQQRDFSVQIYLLSFPIEIHWHFILMACLLSVGAGGFTRFVMSMTLVMFGVLAHEFGHAVISSAVGRTNITIQLHGLGGLTSSTRSGTRAQDVAIVLAGPAVGVFLGLAILPVTSPNPELGEHWFLSHLLFVTLGWSLLNLLPIMPLDGGQLLAALIRNESVARILSLIAALIGAGVSMWLGRENFLIFFVVLLIANLLTIPSVAAAITRTERRIG